MMHGPINIRDWKVYKADVHFRYRTNYVRFVMRGGGGGIWTGYIEELRFPPVITIPAMLCTHHPHFNAVYPNDRRTKTGKPKQNKKKR